MASETVPSTVTPEPNEAFSRNLGITLSVACQEFSETFNWNLKYVAGGQALLLISPEVEQGTDEYIIDTRQIFANIPPREDALSMLFFIKNESKIAMDIRLKRPNTGAFVDNGTLWPGELAWFERGRSDSSGYSIKLSLDPKDGRAYADLTDEEKRAAYVRIAAFAVDYRTSRP